MLSPSGASSRIRRGGGERCTRPASLLKEFGCECVCRASRSTATYKGPGCRHFGRNKRAELAAYERGVHGGGWQRFRVRSSSSWTASRKKADDQYCENRFVSTLSRISSEFRTRSTIACARALSPQTSTISSYNRSLRQWASRAQNCLLGLTISFN